MRELEQKLTTALKARENRKILRRLPQNTQSLVDFCSNDYLSLSTNPHLRDHFLYELNKAEKVLGSGGSRLLTDVPGHAGLETRLALFFNAPAALLFNSGFDANSGFFGCVPQAGDVLIYDEYIHASVHDGMRSSRARNSTWPFKHNCLLSLERLLRKITRDRHDIQQGDSSVFVAVESLYSMDGDFAPLCEIVELLDLYLPQKNGHLVVDEAHATGIYGDQGRGLVSMLGLENRVTARLHTFGKALAGSGAVILTTPLLRDYLVNYSRPLIYTTALSHSGVINIRCSFDVLESDIGKQLSAHLTLVCFRFLDSMHRYLEKSPSEFLSLPDKLRVPKDEVGGVVSPIIPLLTSHPRPLAMHLQQNGFLTRPITYPTVPKGMDRVRLCLHAGNTIQEVDGLLKAIVEWVEAHKKVDIPSIRSKL